MTCDCLAVNGGFSGSWRECSLFTFSSWVGGVGEAASPLETSSKEPEPFLGRSAMDQGLDRQGRMIRKDRACSGERGREKSGKTEETGRARALQGKSMTGRKQEGEGKRLWRMELNINKPMLVGITESIA